MASLRAAFQMEGQIARKFGGAMRKGISSMMEKGATSASRKDMLFRMGGQAKNYLMGSQSMNRMVNQSWKRGALRTGVVAGAGLVGAYGAYRVVQSDSMVGSAARFGIGAGLVGGGAYLGYRNWGRISGAMASRFGRRGTTAATRHVPGGRTSTSPGSLGTDMGRGSYGPTPMARPVVPPLPDYTGPRGAQAVRNLRDRVANPRPALRSGRGSLMVQGRRNNQGFAGSMFPSNRPYPGGYLGYQVESYAHGGPFGGGSHPVNRGLFNMRGASSSYSGELRHRKRNMSYEQWVSSLPRA